jgi:hypothetical protein
MTKPFKRDLTIYQGATFRETVTWKTGATAASATPVNLTGYTAKAQIREEQDSATVIHEMTTENGGITLGGTAGTYELYISDEDTAEFIFDAAVYDVELNAPNGDVIRRQYGKITLSKEVTR